MVNSDREASEFLKDQYEKDLTNTEKMLKTEMSWSEYLSGQLKDAKEDLAKERAKTVLQKFMEKHHFFKSSKSCTTRSSNRHWFKDKVAFPLVIWPLA